MQTHRLCLYRSCTARFEPKVLKNHRISHPKWKMTSRVMPKRAKRVYWESVAFQRGGAKYRAIVISTTGLEVSGLIKPPRRHLPHSGESSSTFPSAATHEPGPQ